MGVGWGGWSARVLILTVGHIFFSFFFFFIETDSEPELWYNIYVKYFTSRNALIGTREFHVIGVNRFNQL